MNNIQQVLDPSCKLIISESAISSAQAKYPLDSRQLFYYLTHISEHYEVLPIARDFVEQALTLSTEQSKVVIVKNFDIEVLQVKCEQLQRIDLTLTEPDDVKTLLEQFAPVMLTTPSWLQNISQTATSDDPIIVDLFAVYLRLVQSHSGDMFCDHNYKALLLSYDCDLPGVSTWAFAQQLDINNVMFEFGTLQLALGQLTRLYFPEIIGFTLACCQAIENADALVSLQLSSGQQSFGKLLTVQQQLAATQTPIIKQIIQRYLGVFAQQEPALWHRIQRGHWLYRHHLHLCLETLQKQLQTPDNPQQVLIKLLQRIAPKAAGHHGKIELNGKNLDAWFSQEPFASEKFLSSLLNSSYVDKDNPEQSQLLKLFDFSGPMFGVFNNRDKQTIKDWIAYSVGDNAAADIPTPQAKYEVLSVPKIAALPASVPINFTRLSNREFFYYLINADLYPEVYASARARVQSILTKTRWLSRMPFKQYQHQRFDDYVQNHYQTEMAAYKPFQAPPKLSRSTYEWGIEQLAPTILTDGCWLQGAGQLQYFSHYKIGEYLFSIYSDEVGAGDRQRNHPYIYQQLLQSLDIDLPLTHSQEFVRHSGFVASAFDIPVYLMAIGHFPSQFLPELLGVNLAIELSGLGRLYLSLADELDYWGIDPAIVNIHTSIDNVATGHTALATDAIQLYLDGILASQGIEVMNKHWRRIYTGYCSLRIASTRFKYSMVYKYLQKRLRYRLEK